MRASEIFASPIKTQACYEQFLEGKELEAATENNAEFVEKHHETVRRMAEMEKYVAVYGTPEPPFKYSYLVKRPMNSDAI